MGWAEGLQSGLALGRAFKEGQERRKMEEIQSAAPTEMQGYTAAQGTQLEGLAKSGGYDIVPQYAAPAEGQTQGLFTGYQAVPKANLQDQAGWDMPAAAQTIAPQRVTEFLGQRYEGGLAPERIETMRTRAMANAMTDPMRRQQALLAVTGEERAQAAEGRAARGFETSQKESGLRIGEMERTKAERDADLERQKKLSEEWSDRLSVKDAEGKVTGMRAPTNEDMMWSAQRNAQNLAAAGKMPEAIGAFKDYMATAKGQIELQRDKRGEALRTAAAKVNNGDYSGAKDFYDEYVPDGAKVKEFKENKDGSITVKRVDLHGNAMPDTKTTKDELLKGLVSFNDPAKLIDYAQQSFMNNLHTQQLKVSQGQLGVSQKNLQLHEDMAQTAKIQGALARQDRLEQTDVRNVINAPRFKDAATGEVVMVDPTKLKTDNRGVYITPKGLVPLNERLQPSDASLVQMAKNIKADTRTNFVMKDGRRMPLSDEQAMAEARKLLAHGQSVAPAGDDGTQALIEAMRQSQ